MAESPWTEDEITILRILWEAGITARAIGEAIQKTRNQIIGKAWRMKLKRK